MGILPGQSLPELRASHIDKPFVQSTIDSLAQVIRKEYVDADVASHIDAYITKGLAEGRYQMPTADALAQVLTQDLFDSSHDKHIFVTVSQMRPTHRKDFQHAGFRNSKGGPSLREVVLRRSLPFYRPQEAQETFVSAAQVLAQANACANAQTSRLCFREGRG